MKKKRREKKVIHKSDKLHSKILSKEMKDNQNVLILTDEDYNWRKEVYKRYEVGNIIR